MPSSLLLKMLKINVFKHLNSVMYDITNHPLTININIFKQIINALIKCLTKSK